MGKKGALLFDSIAPIYGLFFKLQKKRYHAVIARASTVLDLTQYATVLDVGCGTGALCAVLHEKGIAVTGIDPAQEMLRVARRQPENQRIPFIVASVLDPLPFADKSFDVSIASYVAHGLQKHEREQMYAEMSRLSKSKVIIYDYNQKRAWLTSFVEWLERGDYFRFIKVAKKEMENCSRELEACFSEVTMVDVDTKAAWYLCTPR